MDKGFELLTIKLVQADVSRTEKNLCEKVVEKIKKVLAFLLNL